MVRSKRPYITPIYCYANEKLRKITYLVETNFVRLGAEMVSTPDRAKNLFAEASANQISGI